MSWFSSSGVVSSEDASLYTVMEWWMAAAVLADMVVGSERGMSFNLL